MGEVRRDNQKTDDLLLFQVIPDRVRNKKSRNKSWFSMRKNLTIKATQDKKQLLQTQ